LSAASPAPATTEREVTNAELVRFFSVLSHDLKSPIFSIDGFSDLLMSDYEDRLDEEGKDFLRRIRSSAQQMKRVLDEMSNLVKLLSKPSRPRPTPLNELVEEVLVRFGRSIDEGGVVIEVPKLLPTLNVDPEKTRELLGALVSNALFFNDRAKGERKVSITCESEGDGYSLCVADNGIGFEPQYGSQILELGLKLDKSRGGGPGYGLYLVKRVAESNGGLLTAESAPGAGSRFCVTFPAQQ
jgi:light-regulated signal transduction histidine kinase (bacteriophytochrome)